MEPEGSLSCSEWFATGSYDEPGESSLQLPNYFYKTHSSMIFPSTPMSPKWTILFRFSDRKIACISQLSHACYVPRSSHPPLCNYSNKQVMKLLIIHSSPLFRPFLYSMLCGSPSHHGASSGCGWRRRPPNMDGSCEYIWKSVANSREGVVLQPWGWPRC
jgi:hypothetical protein